MTKFGDELARAWALLSSGTAGPRAWRAMRIETEHPLDVFAAVREADAVPSLLFECPTTSAPTWKLRFDSEGIRLQDDRDGSDGRRRISLSLERRDLESVFLVVAEDLVNASRDCTSLTDALVAVGARLSAWQACLKLRRNGFSSERALGLYGELVFLEYLASRLGFPQALVAWQGPYRGLHDFQATTAAIEVKTTSGLHGAVSVGSLDQLDPTGVDCLALCRVAVVSDSSGLSLAGVVGRIRRALDVIGPTVRRRFDEALLMSGYLDADGAQLTTQYSTDVLELYEVRTGFPRLTREHVSPSIESAEYRLSLASATPFRMNTPEIAKLLASFAQEVPHAK